MHQPRIYERIPPIAMNEARIARRVSAYSSEGAVEQIGESSPFVFLAGHLSALAELYKKEGSLSPEQIVDKEVNLLIRYQNLPWYRFGSGRRRRSANEVLGSRPEQEIKFRRTGKDLLEGFANLSDEELVKIANGQNDSWSEGYAASDYSRRYYNLPPFRVMSEPVIVDVFLETAKKLGIEEDKIEVTEGPAVYSNRSKPKIVKSLVTTAQVVRHVVANEAFQAEIHQRIRP